MQLHQLLFGKSKKKMSVIMIDSLHKCQKYQKARENNVRGCHKIELAPIDSKPWKQKTCSIRGGGDKRNCGPRVVGKGLSGYISKNHGFCENT